jgi:NAD(P)-dependent dehydrogenase (short-subunit alcohol dehydrogenase family)
MDPVAKQVAKEIPAELGPVDLSGRTILITGASGGFGRALAIECGRAGASVVLAGRDGAKLDRLYDEIVALGAPQPAIVQLDLASAAAQDYDRLADTIDREFGKLDGLVHAAALLGDRTPLEQYDVPTWCRVLHVNLTAPFILTQVLLPNLRKSADASVIFVSSGVARKPREMLAQELEGQETLRVNSVNPGRMRTAMRAAAYPAEDPNSLPAPAAVTGLFLYLLSAEGRGIDGRYFDAQ